MPQVYGDDVVQAALALSRAKREEEASKERRLAAEEKLIELVEFNKPEGSATFHAEGDTGTAEFTLTQPISTKVDAVEWPKLRRQLDTHHPGRRIFRTKYEIDKKAARDLESKSPAHFAEIASVITRKPGKVAVKLGTIDADVREEVS